MTPPIPIALAPLLLPGESVRPVPGFDRYWATSTGRVLSTVDIAIVVQPWAHSAGYLKVDLYRGSSRVAGTPNRKKEFVHTIVAAAFHGPRPIRPGIRYHVDHINGNKKDNRPENLAYVTAGENVRRAIARGLFKTKLTPVAVWTLRCLAVHAGEEVAIEEGKRLYGVARRAARSALAGRTWPSVPDPATHPSASKLASALMVEVAEAFQLLKLSPFEPVAPPEGATIYPLRPQQGGQAA